MAQQPSYSAAAGYPPGHQEDILGLTDWGKRRSGSSEHPVLRQRKAVFLNEVIGALDGILVLDKPTLAARACDGLRNAGFSSLRDIDLQGLGLGKQVLRQ